MIIESICSLPDSCKKRIKEKYGIKDRKVVAVLHFADTAAELDEHGMVELTNPSSLGFFNKYFWIGVTKICCGYNHLVGLRDNGTVVYYGDNTYGQCNVGKWRNVVLLMADKNYTVGITKDREILETGEMFAPPKAEPPVQVRNVKKPARNTPAEYKGIPKRLTDAAPEEGASYAEPPEMSIKRKLPTAEEPDTSSAAAVPSDAPITPEQAPASEAPAAPETPQRESATEAAPAAETAASESSPEAVPPSPPKAPAEEVKSAAVTAATALAEEAKAFAQAAAAKAAQAASAAKGAEVSPPTAEGGAKEETVFHINTGRARRKQAADAAAEAAAAAPPPKMNVTPPGGRTETKPLNSDTGQRLRNGGEQLLRSFSKRLSTCTSHTLGVRADGKVFAAGADHYGQCRISRCRNVRAVSAGDGYSVALFASGNVVAEGMDKFGRCQTDRWENIVVVCAGSDCTIGVCQNGTLVTAGKLPPQNARLRHWNQVVDVSQEVDRIFALTNQGVLLSTDPQVDRLRCTNIAAISSGPNHTLLLQKDGKVLVLGRKWSEKYQVQGWEDMVAVSAGTDHSVGLRRDGRVMAVGNNEYHQCEVGNWTDMIAIAAGEKQTIGLKADGSVLAVGAVADGRCEVSGWNLFCC